MPFATRGNQNIRETAQNCAYYLLQDLRHPVNEFQDFGGGLIPNAQGYFSGCAAELPIVSVGSNSSGRHQLIPQYLMSFGAL